MSPGTQIMMSGALTFGVPVAVGIYELLALRRRRPGSWDPGPDPEPAPPPPHPGGANRKLPDCLIPNLPPRAPAARSRVLETV